MKTHPRPAKETAPPNKPATTLPQGPSGVTHQTWLIPLATATTLHSKVHPSKLSLNLSRQRLGWECLITGYSQGSLTGFGLRLRRTTISPSSALRAGLRLPASRQVGTPLGTPLFHHPAKGASLVRKPTSLPDVSVSSAGSLRLAADRPAGAWGAPRQAEWLPGRRRCPPGPVLPAEAFPRTPGEAGGGPPGLPPDTAAG